MSSKSSSIVATTPNSANSLPKYVSPTTVSRNTRRPIGTPRTNTSSTPQLYSATHQDEFSEARNRRRSFLQERRPSPTPRTPNDGNNSNILNRLTSAQQMEHHTDCIKLSVENKINAKNAFALHLIDCMTMMLRSRQLENFQVASSTLDASAKIYAGRVDAVHTDTYKLMVGLGSRPTDEQEGDDGDDNIGDENNKNKKKRRKGGKKSRIANRKKITRPFSASTVNHDVDDLHINATAFDDTGSIINHLTIINESTRLNFDGHTPVFGDNSNGDPSGGRLIEVSQFKDVLRNIDSKIICPQFNTFTFTEWTENESTLTEESIFPDDKHCFDADAPPDLAPVDDIDDCNDDDFGGGETMHDISQAFDGMQVSNPGSKDHIVDASINVANPLCHIRDGTVSDLVHVLTGQNSDFNYFNKLFLRSWAGPSHWSLKPSTGSLFCPSDPAKKPIRKKRTPLRIEFDDDKTFSVFLKVKKIATRSKAVISKYVAESALLPGDVQYTGVNLANLFIRPHIMPRRRKERVSNVDGNIANYDYDNENDAVNFCPANDDGDDEFDGDADLFNLTDGSSTNFGLSQDMTQINSMLNNMSLAEGGFVGDNLVAQPHKVPNIEINYARTAKRIDVKRLKSTMWNVLTDTDLQPPETPGPNKSDKHMSQHHTFQQLLSSLPDKLSKQSANNLSVPIAFVCLLHLANEKILTVDEMEGMSNLDIGQIL